MYFATRYQAAAIHDEQGTYWRRNLSRLVTNGLGTESTVNYEFSLEDQFRGELVAS